MDKPPLTCCPICGAPRPAVSNDTWFFVATPQGASVVCSRLCLLKFVQALPEKELPPVVRLKQGTHHVIMPHRRE
jgi:hypothetical protein